jgi:uncharacterized protein DUF4149
MLCFPQVETLYFDLLQFLYHLALAVLVGGAFVLGAAVGPAVFAAARSREQAGVVFGAALARFDGFAILALIVLVVTSALKAAAFELTGSLELRLLARWTVLAVLAAATLYSSAWANPVARSIRGATPGFDDLPASAPARIEFARLHERSRRAMSLAVVAGLLALFLS